MSAAAGPGGASALVAAGTAGPGAGGAQQQHPTRLIFLVETTYAAAAMWSRTREWCFENILRHVESASKQQQQQQQQQQGGGSASAAPTDSTSPSFQIAVISFGTVGPYSPYTVESSGWTSDTSHVRRWLDRLRFLGGGTCSAALLEALTEAVYLAKHPYPGGALPPAAPGCDGGAKPPPPHTHCVLLSVSPHGRQNVRWSYPAETKAARLASGFYKRLAALLPPAHAKGVAEGAASGSSEPGAADLQDVSASLPDHGVTLSAVGSIRMAPVLQGKILLTLRHSLPGVEPRVWPMPGGCVLLLSPDFALATEALRPVLLQAKQLRAARAGKPQQQQQPAQQQQLPQQQQQQQQPPVAAGGRQPSATSTGSAGGGGGMGLTAQNRAALAAAADAAARLANGGASLPLHQQQQQQLQQHQQPHHQQQQPQQQQQQQGGATAALGNAQQPHKPRIQLWSGTLLWNPTNGSGAAWGIPNGTPFAEAVLFAVGAVPPHVEAIVRRQDRRGGMAQVTAVGGVNELKQALARWRAAGGSQDTTMFRITRTLGGWDALKRSFDSFPEGSRPDVCLMASLAPDMQAALMLTRVRKPTDRATPPPGGGELQLHNHCFLSVPLAGGGG